jgi:iron complex transport system substrate-binding protein
MSKQEERRPAASAPAEGALDGTPVRRVVSLACSNTEIVSALGCAHLLVGVDDHSDHPDAVVAALPRVGPDLDIDVDRVAALEPDLVLATLTVPGHERIVERLEAAGLPYIAPEPVSLDDVYRDVRDIGARLSVPERARALVESMRASMGDDGPGRASAPAGTPADPPLSSRPRVIIQWWPKPTIAPGRLSWTNDVLERAGGLNPIGHEPVKSRPIPDEEVAEIAPDAVVIAWCGVHPSKYRPDVVLDRKVWANTPAVRNGHVFCVPEAFLGRPGPRLVDGFRALRHVVERVRDVRGME